MLRALLVLAIGLLVPAPALACSCMQPALTRRVLPRDGARGFPIDGTLRVFTSGFSEIARPLLGAEYRLLDTSGAAIALDVSVVGTRLDLRPHAPLAPSATYTLEQVFAFDAAGTRLTDLERASATTALRGAWSPVATFETSATSSSTRAIAPTITTQLFFAYGGGDCGPAASLQADLALPPGAIDTDIVELRTRHHGVLTSLAAVGAERLYAGDMLCDPDPVTLPPGASIEVSAVIVDASGHELGASAWSRARGHGTRPASHARGSSSGWPSVTMLSGPITTVPRGPSTCANGLEVVSRHDVVSTGAPWAFGDRTTIASDASARWIAYGADVGPMQLFSIAADGTSGRVSTSVAGYPTALLATSSGPFVAWATYTQTSHVIGHVARLDAHGAPSWSLDLPAEGSDYRIARGGGQVLAAWTTPYGMATAHLSYAIFDEQTGAIVTSQAPTSFDLDLNAEGPAVAFVDGRFVIVWGTALGISRGPLMALVVSSATATRQSLAAIDSYSPPDLVGAGTYAGLVTASASGRVSFSVLDRDGALRRGPFDVSAGIGGTDNRLPRIAWNGREFAIAWETLSPPAVYVAVADAAGAVSATLRVDDEEPFASSIGITSSVNGWLAGYTVDRGRGRIAELRCRSRAPIGPPQTIGAAP